MATPVRNVRIPDSMWEKLGNLAYKRKTTITALLVEGAEYILDAGGYSKPDAPSTEALQQELKALALRVKELEGQLGGQTINETLTNDALPVPPTDEALTQTVNVLTQRLDRIETTIAPLIHALEQVPRVVKDEVDTSGAEEETDNSNAKKAIEDDANSDSESELEPKPTLPSDLKPPLSQRELSQRLGTSTQNLSNKRGRETPREKANFEAWSKRHDPDGIAWTWIGRPGGKGIPMRYIPVKP